MLSVTFLKLKTEGPIVLVYDVEHHPSAGNEA